jgi:hypothetical protein
MGMSVSVSHILQLAEHNLVKNFGIVILLCLLTCIHPNILFLVCCCIMYLMMAKNSPKHVVDDN